MSRLDSETKRKLREMGVSRSSRRSRSRTMRSRSGWCSSRDSSSPSTTPTPAFTQSKVDGLIRPRRSPLPERGPAPRRHARTARLDRGVIAQLGTCQFITRQMNMVFQGFTGSGKSYLGSALAKQGCQHRYRAHYIRMPDLEESWASVKRRGMYENGSSIESVASEIER